MRKLPGDKYGNIGWSVMARKPHRCEVRNDGCQGILAETPYYRAIAWPRTDVNNGRVPWVMKICRDCLTDERRLQFDQSRDPELFGIDVEIRSQDHA